MTALYHVRQYRPNYFTGFENSVVYNQPYEQILAAPWFNNFKHEGFEKFVIEPYSGELIISAHYTDGKHYVAGFAINADSKVMSNNGDLMVDNWRYKPHES